MLLNHPPKDQLIAFGQGMLTADESSHVEQHLEECHDCCATLLDLKDDTFVGLVKIASVKMADAADVRTDPGTDANDFRHESVVAATILEQSCETVGPDELPPELAGHLRYGIVELIGRGGMGNVYRAEHRLMNRPVAIKLINSQLIRQPQAVERFRREVQAAAKLTHPNIVTAYDAEQAGDVHFLVMEFVEGTDLASVVKHRGPMSVAEACRCIRQVAEGLQHAHEKGMVHRDIKPHNLMLSAEGQVRILDFGLAGFTLECGGSTPLSLAAEPLSLAPAHSSESLNGNDKESDFVATRSGVEPPHSKALTTAGSVMGTPDYIAPEQAKDAHSADIRADIYSLGCTLHFLLTGKPPFEADNVLAKLKAHAQETPPALTALRKDVPIELEQVASRMLAKNPIERFQTPAEVVAALRPFTKSVAFRSAKGRSFAERKTTLATVLGVVLLLAGVIVVTSNRGRLEIHSEVEDVKVSVTKGGEQVEVFDLKTGSQMKWLPSGEYELQVVGKDNDVKLDKAGFTMSRLGQVIVTANWNAAGRGVVRAFSTAEKPITQDGVVVDEGGWKMTASENRTVRLFEIPQPQLDAGPFFFRAKLRTENVTGRAYLELWNRFPGKGEFFSKGIQHAVSGTTGWAEYEIPFYLKKGEQPDLVKLNVTIEGRGTVWIKDIELRGRAIGHSSDSATPASTDPASLGAVEREALKVAEAFLAVVDEGNFDKLYDSGSNLAKKQAKRAQVVPLYQQIRDTAGKVEKRTLQRVRLIDEFLGLPPGRYAAVQYVSDFEKHKGLWETVMLNVDDDGQWRANTYAVTVQPLPLPESKDKPQPAANTPLQNRVGLLTNPPKLPPEGVLVGRNLIVDSSLEATPTGDLPQGWFAWLDDGPDFKCEVVEGGVTGKHCLQISGTGKRGVVFATSIPLDRTKRYALKGRVKVEGEAGTWAVIKLNYFNNTGWLGVDDRVGVTSSDLDWKLLEKTDLAEKYPAATLLVPTCHIEGNGTAWFDDLEVIAYDRDKLPADFDAKHGRNNRMK